MNVALIGSVSSSWYALNALIRCGVEVTCVMGVDERRGIDVCDYRSLRALAGDAGVPYLSFVRVTEPEVTTFVRQHQPDLLWVIGLSQLVPDAMIDIARAGGVGFHPTMLPKGRGRAPVAWTILLDQPAAVNLFYLSDQADAGDIIVQREVPVLPDDYSEDLIHRTNVALAEVIETLAPAIKNGTLPRIPQDHSQATYYKKRTPADGLIGRNRLNPYTGSFAHQADPMLVRFVFMRRRISSGVHNLHLTTFGLMSITISQGA